jgi:hypothetical protein
MIVKLKNSWFAPSAKFIPDKLRVFSGKRFKAGEQVIEDGLFDFLPKSAVVIEGPSEKAIEKEVPVPVEPSLKDYDMERAAAEKEMEVQNDNHARMEKARAARAAKKAAKEAKE